MQKVSSQAYERLRTHVRSRTVCFADAPPAPGPRKQPSATVRPTSSPAASNGARAEPTEAGSSSRDCASPAEADFDGSDHPWSAPSEPEEQKPAGRPARTAPNAATPQVDVHLESARRLVSKTAIFPTSPAENQPTGVATTELVDEQGSRPLGDHASSAETPIVP